MSQMLKILSLKLTLPPDVTEEEREETLLHLQRELLETDVRAVENDPNALPPTGAKGLAVGLDSLLITLAGSGSLLSTVVSTVGTWLTERRKCSATLKLDGDEITITNPSAEDQRKLIAAFLARHSSG
jgi:Effector Associated Constant Component 1